MKRLILLSLSFFMFPICLIYAQEQDTDQLKPGRSLFLLRGYAHSGLEIYKENSSFTGGSFNPIFLWHQSDRLLFEAELEIELEGGETKIGLEYANMSYILSNRVTFRFGLFLLPFGIFSERLHPRWILRLPSAPLGFLHHNKVGPASGLGIEVRGVLPLSDAKMNYAFYAINGPVLNNGLDEPEEAGLLHYNNFEDNNKNKGLGGRIGLLPFSNSALELGGSAQYAKVGDTESEFENIAASMYAADLSLTKHIGFLKGVVDIKAQWNWINVDNANYLANGEHDDEGEEHLDEHEDGLAQEYTFDNKSQAYFGRISFRPSFVGNSFLRNLEFVGRHSATKLPAGALWGKDERRLTIGVNYWLDWRTVLKVAYQFVSDSPHEENEHGDQHSNGGGNGWLIHWAFGF